MLTVLTFTTLFYTQFWITSVSLVYP